MTSIRKKLCSYDELQDPGSKGLNIKVNGTELRLFIVKKNKDIFIYENSCPHTLGPLDWLPDNFLDIDKKYILCANHGALFQIDDGLCIDGPCKKQSLHVLPFVIDDGTIYLLY